MYRTRHNFMSSESDNSMDEFAVKEDSDEETGAWITEVTEWHNKLSSKNFDLSSGSEDEMRMRKPHSIITPARFLYSAPRVDMKPLGNDPQSSKGHCNSGLKRKLDDMGEMMSDYDDEAEMEGTAEGAEVAAGDGAAPDVNMQTYPNDEKERDGEVLILTVDCLLYGFSNLSSTWVQKAAGKLSVFDYDNESRGIQSRVVVRSQRTMRIILNSKIWSGMSIEKRSQRSIRITALDAFGQAKVYLLSVTIEQLDEVYGVLRERIENVRKDMSKNYLTRYESNAMSSKRRALGGHNGAAKNDDNGCDRIDPSELD